VVFDLVVLSVLLKAVRYDGFVPEEAPAQTEAR
jgi:hypothetical protein